MKIRLNLAIQYIFVINNRINYIENGRISKLAKLAEFRNSTRLLSGCREDPFGQTFWALRNPRSSGAILASGRALSGELSAEATWALVGLLEFQHCLAPVVGSNQSSVIQKRTVLTLEAWWTIHSAIALCIGDASSPSWIR